MTDKLIELGMSPNEALVYSTLVGLGPCFVAPIIQRTQKHRHIVYSALETLERKSLVTTAKKNGKKFYSITDPNRLLHNARQKELLAEEIAADIEKRLQTEKEQVETFVGVDAYEQGLADFRLNAEKHQEYIVIGGQPVDWYEYTRPFFAQHVEDLRRLKRNGIDIQILFFESERKSAHKYIVPYAYDPYIIKITNTDPRLPHTTWLAGEHVYILTPTSAPLVTHIKSKALAEAYRTYFEKIWRSTAPIKKLA
jgi:sugar-specific transcriptional regulator TrmB